MADLLCTFPQDLLEVLAGYGTLTAPNSLQFPTKIPFLEAHAFLLDHILLNSHFNKYPPCRQYQNSFWKWAINKLESMINSEEVEIDERIYEHYIYLMPTPACSSPQTVGSTPPAPSYMTYLWKLNERYQRTTLMESRTTIESGTTGLKTWPASLVLAEHLISHPELIQQKRVLELGCGVGLLGMIISTIQQSKPSLEGNALYLTDIRQDVLQRCQNNVNLPCNASSAHSRLTCLPLDWTDALDPSKQPEVQKFLSEIDADLILGADVVYDPSIIPALVATLRLALDHSTHRREFALLALAVRNPSTIATFLEVARLSLHLEEIQILTNEKSVFVGMKQGREREVKIYQLSTKIQ